MITGAHFLFYSANPEADRAFFRDILGFQSVDAGGGWLIFQLPPAEIAVHPSSKNLVHAQGGHSVFGALMYLMCDDLQSSVDSLKARNVTCGPVTEESWGIQATIR